MKNFGEKLKELREERNLSQKELGEKMGGITQQTIAQYEKKETVPKLETVSREIRKTQKKANRQA